jgi:cytosine deaminase
MTNTGDGTDWKTTSFDAAVREARAGLDEGGVPVGGALDLHGELVATGRNLRVQQGDPTAHGEISCLREAGRRASYRSAVLYTTLAPCAMCAGAIIQFRIPRVVVGEANTFPGELQLLRSRGVEVVVLDDQRCSALMREFQERYPQVWDEDIGEVS